MPPANTRFERPDAIDIAALSSACMPEAQLRCTVYAGTRSPQPSRRATIRAILASSGPGMVDPKITSSNSVASNGMRNSSERAA